MVALCLVILSVLSVFSVILGGTWTGTPVEFVIDNTAIINGTVSEFSFETTGMFFGIDPISGAIATIIGFVTVAALVGAQIFGSGLSDSNARALMYMIIYSSLWTMLSILSAPLIFSVPVFGAVLYVGLTIAYAVGGIQNVIRGGD